MLTGQLIDGRSQEKSKPVTKLKYRFLSFFVSLFFLQTEGDGQDKDPERLRGETDCFSLVQYGKKDFTQPVAGISGQGHY